MDGSGRSVVSLQYRAATHPVGTHLAWGVLVGSDVVLTPGPLEHLDQVSRPAGCGTVLEAVIPGRSGDIERLACKRLDVVTLAGQPGAIGRARLSRAPSQQPFPAPPATAGDLTRQLSRGDGIWPALERMQAVPSGLTALPFRETLATMGQFESGGRAPVIRFRTFGNDAESGADASADADVIAGICCLLRLQCCRSGLSGESRNGTSSGRRSA